MIAGLVALGCLQFLASKAGKPTSPMSEKAIKDAMSPKVGNYALRLDFTIIAIPDEVLKAIQNHKRRAEWDYNVVEAVENEKESMVKVSYKSSDPIYPGYLEEIKVKYMINKNKFYIMESVHSPTLGNYERVWILDQVQNRPYFMRVQFLTTVTGSYHSTRSNASALIKSIAALKNMIQVENRDSEMQVTIRQDDQDRQPQWN